MGIKGLSNWGLSAFHRETDIMKLSFTKNYLTFKANEIADIGDEATDLIAKGIAVEIKEDANAVLLAAVEDKVKEVAEQAYAKGRDEAKAEIAKAFRSSNKPAIVVGDDRATLDPTKGFKSFGSFVKGLKDRSMNIDSDEARNFAKAGIAESTDGAAVPVEYADVIFQIVNSEDSLLSMTEQLPTTTNHLYLPTDSLVQFGTNAVTGSWIPEGTQATAVGTGLLNQQSFTLNKYMTLASITDEMLADNNVLIEQFTTAKAGYDIVYAVNQAIIQGSGSGQPKGILNSAALVTVTADTADEYVSGNDFSYKDIKNMYSHFLQRQGKSNPVWIINPVCKQYVYGLQDGANRSLWFAPGTVQQTSKESLFGLPIVWSWHAKTPGTPGDIILADMAAYVTLVKKEGVQAASSMHLYFDKDAMAYRYTIRIDGKPAIGTAFTAPDGVTKFSPFVALGTRS